jgi:hypothetical protein
MFGGMPPGAGHMKETDGCTGSFWYVRYRTRPSKEDKKRTHFVKQREGVRPCLRVWKTNRSHLPAQKHRRRAERGDTLL